MADDSDVESVPDEDPLAGISDIFEKPQPVVVNDLPRYRPGPKSKKMKMAPPPFRDETLVSDTDRSFDKEEVVNVSDDDDDYVAPKKADSDEAKSFDDIFGGVVINTNVAAAAAVPESSAVVFNKDSDDESEAGGEPAVVASVADLMGDSDEDLFAN